MTKSPQVTMPQYQIKVQSSTRGFSGILYPAGPAPNCSTWRLQACQIDTLQETSNEKIEKDMTTKYVPMGFPQEESRYSNPAC